MEVGMVGTYTRPTGERLAYPDYPYYDAREERDLRIIFWVEAVLLASIFVWAWSSMSIYPAQYGNNQAPPANMYPSPARP